MPSARAIRPSRWHRLTHAVRSYWNGPLTWKAYAPWVGSHAEPSTGVYVTEAIALTYSAFWSAVSRISADVASLPLLFYRRGPDGGKERLVQHPVYWLLHDEPNPEMSAVVFRETLQAHVLTWGNAYAEIERDGRGLPKALWPLTPDRVTPYRTTIDDRPQIAYAVTRGSSGRPDLLPATEILHIPGLGFDGTIGYSVVAQARQSIALGLATEKFGATFFGNGSTFGGVFSHPTTFAPGAQQVFEESIQRKSQGVDRAHQFLTVQEGMSYTPLGIPPDQAQFLESRKFQVTEIARWFNIPPHKIGDLEHATFSNIEQLAIEYVTGTLRPWLIRWEQEANRKLVMAPQKGTQFAEHLMDALLRGDTQSRYAAYAVGRQWGWLSADDVREKENLDPLPKGQGQLYLVPQNMWPAGKVGEMIDAQAQKPAPPAPPAVPPVDPQAQRALELLTTLTARVDAAFTSVAEATTRAEQSDAKATALSADVTATQADRDAARRDAEGHAAEARRLQLLADELTDQRNGLQREVDRLHGDVEAMTPQIAQIPDLVAKIAQAETARDDARLQAERADTLAAESRAAADEAAQQADAARRDQALEAEARAAADQRAADLHVIAADQERSRQTLQVALEEATQAVEAARQDHARETEARHAADQRVADLQTVVANHEQAQTVLHAAADDARQAAAVARQDQSLEATARAAADQRAVDLHVIAATHEGARVALQAALDEAIASSDGLRAAHDQAVQDAAERHASQLADLRQRHDQKLALSRHQNLVRISHTMRRMVTLEISMARRAQRSPEKLRAWAEAFYPGHAARCAESLRDDIAIHLTLAGSSDDPEIVTRDLVRTHVAESTRQLHAVSESGDGPSFQQLLDETLERWLVDRHEQPAQHLLAREGAA